MSVRSSFILVFGMCAVGLGFVGVSAARNHFLPRRTLYGQTMAPEGTLRRFAQNAYLSGQNSVTVDEFPGYLAVHDMAGAINDYSVVIATVNARFTYYDEDLDTIITYYKLSVEQTLSQRPQKNCGGCTPEPNPPNELLPISSGQIYFRMPHGVTTLENVTVDAATSRFSSSALVVGQRCLAFLSLDSPAGSASLRIGPEGLYLIGADGNSLSPLSVIPAGDEGPINLALHYQFGNSLTQFKHYFGY